MHTTPSSLKLKRACIMGITQQNIAVRYSNHYAIRSPTRYFSWQCFSQIFVYDMNLINKIENICRLIVSTFSISEETGQV